MAKGIKFKTRIDIFGTLVGHKVGGISQYLNDVRLQCKMLEEAHCRGALIFSDNSQLDPWTIAQLVILSTNELNPLVAVQPLYMHPYAAAKLVWTLSTLHHRKIWLNMVAGGFPGDLEAFGDSLSHDERYSRLESYVSIMNRLLRGENVAEDFAPYFLRNLSLTPPLDSHLLPEVFLAGSSKAGAEAACRLGAVSISHPDPAEFSCEPAAGRKGLRVGIVARLTDTEAWEAANVLYPYDRRGEIKNAIAMARTDSAWRIKLDNQAREASSANRDPDAVFWYRPFQVHRAQSPIFVGSYDRVGAALAKCITAEHEALIINPVQVPSEMSHIILAVNASGC